MGDPTAVGEDLNKPIDEVYNVARIGLPWLLSNDPIQHLSLVAD